MGLVKLDGNQATSSCELYRLYFGNQLEEETKIDLGLQPLATNQLDAKNLNDLDELTHLPNRIAFNQALEIQWQQLVVKKSPIALILCDIDYFRFYNKAHGYVSGEACLQQIAITIETCITHPSAILAHYGGEEFAIVLPEINIEEAVEVAEKIRKSVKALAIAHEQDKIGGFPASVLTVSLGVAVINPSLETSTDRLLAIAKSALLEAKRQGRDRIFQANPLLD